MNVQWSHHAKQQVAYAYDYILSSDGETRALQTTRRIIHRVALLERFPRTGRPGRVPGTRELIISDTPFVVAYAVHAKRVVILAVYHGAQRWPDDL